MSKKLSILTATLTKRSLVFHNLARILNAQSNNSVEMLANIDDGEKTIGAKRNELLNAAQGDYIVFVDDDDMVSPYFISSILEAIKDQPDCVGIEGIITQKHLGSRKFIHSIKYKEWYEENNIYYRCPNHLNPVKREIALKVGFPDLSYQEDKDYSLRLKEELVTEVYITDPIYFYYPSTTG